MTRVADVAHALRTYTIPALLTLAAVLLGVQLAANGRHHPGRWSR